MKILMICPFPFPSVGGAEGLVYELAKSLASKNEVFILSFSSGYKLSENTNLHIYHLKKGRIGFMKNFFIIFKLTKKVRPHIIHAHFVFPAAIWGIVGKLFKIPIIVTSHGADIQKSKEIGYGARLNKVIAIITWLTLKLINVHIVVSKSMIKDAIKAGSISSNIQVIYNGIDLKKTQNRETSVFQQYNISEDQLIVLYLSRLHPKKRPEDLIMAFPKVIKRLPNARLIIAGKGPEERKLKKLVSDIGINDKVMFTGFVSEDEKWDLLRRCAIFVLPSIVEGHPIAVIEAMACGKPVVVTNIGPFPEIVRDGETGLLVPPCSPGRLANAIINLLLNEKRAKMGEKAKRETERRFTIEKISDEYLKLYRKLVNSK